MNDRFHITEILKDGLHTVYNPIRRIFLLFIMPLALSSLIVIVFKSLFTDFYVSIVISSLAIFTGFFFTLIVYVADKATNKKRELKDSINEEDERFLKKYLQFSERLITQISYSIVLSIIIIAITVLTQFNICIFEFSKHIELLYYNSISIIAFAAIFHFSICLLLIVSNMYALFLEEIKMK